jgi:uncharacterized membrane protein YfcA
LQIDGWQILAGAVAGIVVGLTGMGGGALLTPALILVFGINPGTAVSSDLLTSLVMRPLGGFVHARRKTVEWKLVGWLCLGSVPAGFCAASLARALGNSPRAGREIEFAIGCALASAVGALVAKAAIGARRAGSGSGSGSGSKMASETQRLQPRPIPTVLIGVLGGLMVGMTSVGSGSLMMVLLLVVYPQLSSKRLVGTDLVQAVPLIGAATLGHAIYGHVNLGVVGSLLIGSIPGTYLGARLSVRAPDSWVRPVLGLVLLSTSIKLLGVPLRDAWWVASGLALAGGFAALALRSGNPLQRARHLTGDTVSP